MPYKSKAVVLFSGGLDSILAAKLLADQDIQPICLHIVTPFFGNKNRIGHWRRLYNLDIHCIDAGKEFVNMLANSPKHGYGKTLNPCVDCKILQFQLARQFMTACGADFIATGEVLGQRPMSQRAEMINHIPRAAGLQGLVLRPLCAGLLKPVQAEIDGLVDRSRLLSLSGRGRNPQLELASHYNLKEIPTPAGGCRLTEKETSRRYWHILKSAASEIPACSMADLAMDMELANHGRMYIFNQEKNASFLFIGRNANDNSELLNLSRPEDLALKLAHFPGPIALARKGRCWPKEQISAAAAILAGFSRRALEQPSVEVELRPTTVRITVQAEKPSESLLPMPWEKIRALVHPCSKTVSQP